MPLDSEAVIRCLLGSLPLPFTAYFTVQKSKKTDRQGKENKKVTESRGKSQHSARGRARLCGLALAACPLSSATPPPGKAGVQAAPEPAMALAEHPQGPAWDTPPLAPWPAPSHLHSGATYQMKHLLNQQQDSEKTGPFLCLSFLHPFAAGIVLLFSP